MPDSLPEGCGSRPGSSSALPIRSTAFCDWTVDIGSDDAQTWEIATVVGGWYTDNADRDDVELVTVAKPLDNFMSGGGYLTFGAGDGNVSAGTMAADDDSKAKLSFNVKFNKKGTNLQGKAALRFVVDGQLFELRTNRLDSLGVGEDDQGRPTAQFEAKANISMVLDDGTKVPIDGGPWIFQMDMVDDDGGGDTIGFTVWDRDGILVFSSNWSGTTTLQTLMQGSLQVHGG